MKKQKLSKTKQCLLALVEELEEQGDLWINFLIGGSHPLYRRTFRSGGVKAVQRRRRAEALRAYQKEIRLLERQKWIHVRRIGNQVHCALTPKGKTIALREQIKAASPCHADECVIVIFDIPEKERNVRKRFRHILKECDFVQLQRSVWMSRCDVLLPLQEFIKHSQSKEWIRVFRVLNFQE